MKLLIFFLDGFHPSYLAHPGTTNLRDLAERTQLADLEPILGFSNANKVTLFTGTTPDVHEQWSYFEYAPEHSPFDSAGTSAFRWIDALPGDLTRKAAKFGLSKTYVPWFGRRRGYPRLSWENVPVGMLKHFDHTERSLDRSSVPTLFDHARKAGMNAAWFNVPWYPRAQQLRELDETIRANDIVVMYNANMDAAGHWFAPEPNARFKKWLARTDDLVGRAMSSARRHWGSEHNLMLISDHGMAATTRHINLPRELRKLGGVGRDYIPFIDSTMARFWFRNDSSRARVEELLDRLGHGRVLTREDGRRYGVDFKHKRYGELIYLLEPDTAYYPAYVSWVRPRGMHGYAPDHPTQTALFATSGKKIPSRVHATEVLRYMLASSGIGRTDEKSASVERALGGGADHDHAPGHQHHH